jgi:Thiamine pyrophosphate enzyme, central domain
MAAQAALSKRGVAVLILPVDVSKAEVSDEPAFAVHRATPVLRPSDTELDRIAEVLNVGTKIAIYGGSGCDGAHDEIIALAERLKAPIAHTSRAKDFLEYDNPFNVGMTGVLGIASGYRTLMGCDTLLLLGCDFAWGQFYPDKARIVQVDIEPLTSAAVILWSWASSATQDYSRSPSATPCRTRGSRVPGRLHGAAYERRRKTRQACDDQSWRKDSPAVSCQSDRPSRRCGRDLHRRCWLAHGLAAPPRQSQRHAPYAHESDTRHHGQRHASSARRQEGVSRPPSDLVERRRWFIDADGRSLDRGSRENPDQSRGVQ